MKTYTTATNNYKYFTRDFRFLERWRKDDNIDLLFFEDDDDYLPEHAEKIATGVWAVEA